MTESKPLAEIAKVGAAGSGMWGIVLLILGMLAIIVPFFTGTATAVLVGVILIAAGIVMTIAAFTARSGAAGVFAFLFGILMALTGLVIVARPLIGLASITVALGVYLLVDGIFQIIAGFKARPEKGWGWSLFGGILSLLLAYLIYREWPSSAMWFVGFVVGVRLMFAGFGMLMVGGAQADVADALERA